MSFSTAMTARLRFPTERSRLRKLGEPRESDAYRNPFQRDRDRIVHSRAFRRLAGKTQVTTLPDSQHSRTRLTHTIEVSQVARTVAHALSLNVDLVEALALGHDLGHPAFGHSGEKALDDEMRGHGLRFDHNLHALRIVEHFERRYAAFRGLNLTFEVREGLIKHSRELDPEEPLHQEYLPGLRPLLEAQIIDDADEIAYLSADLEDAVDGGFLASDTICERVPAFARIISAVRSAYPDCSERRALRETQRQLVGMLVNGFIEGVRSAAEASGAKNWEDVRRLPARIARPDESTAATMREIRSVLTESYYDAMVTQRIATRCVDKLKELFRYYMHSPESLPDSHVEQLGCEPLPQVVCDYIAGMTDSFLLRCHDEFLGDRHREQPRSALA